MLKNVFRKKSGLCLLFLGISLSSQAVIIKPLTYHPESGAYTMRLWMGCKAQPADAVVDTGSANLNLLGDKSICHSCTTALDNPTVFTPGKCAKPYQDYFNMQYGTGEGKLRVYQDDLRLEETSAPMPFNFSVYTQGQQVNNVVGLAYNIIAAPSEYPLVSFFSAIEEHYKLENTLSMKLCDTRAPSALSLGGSLVAENKSGWQYTPIVRKDMYSVLLERIDDKTSHQLIISFGSRKMDQLAILDSGTLGLFVFPTNEAQTIKTYLKKYYNQHTNITLPDGFWSQGMCIDAAAVNLNALPTLQFYFAKWDAPNASIKLDIPPARYMNTGGCGTGFVRLAFMGQDSFQQATANFKDHSKLTPLSRSTKILGTPLFENYIVTIHRGEEYNTTAHYDARVGFYSNQNLCQKNYAQH